MANSPKIVISGLGHYHPENIIPNSFFDTLDIGSDGKWVEERTGIKARRSVLVEKDLMLLRRGEVSLDSLRSAGRVMSIADMSARAWAMLEQRSPEAAADIDAVTCGTSVPDFDIPANACTIAGRLGWDVFSADVNSACSSFVVNLHFARGLIAGGLANRIAAFIPERYSLKLNYTDRSSCVLFGDGAIATVIEKDGTQGFELLDTMVMSSPAKFDLVQIPVNGLFSQNGQAVQKFAITRTIEITLAILERNKYSLDDLAYLVGHQANLRMLTAAAHKLGIPDERHLFNVDEFGNQGGAGAPAVLSMHWDRFKKGDLVVVSVVGSGLTWASALLRRL